MTEQEGKTKETKKTTRGRKESSAAAGGAFVSVGFVAVAKGGSRWRAAAGGARKSATVASKGQIEGSFPGCKLRR